MEEYKIGDVFEYKNKKYIIKHQCIENGCKNCTFLDQDDLICSLAGAKSNNLPLCSKLDCIYEEYNEDEKKDNLLDLRKILDGCPKGTKLYLTTHGEVTFNKIDTSHEKYQISVSEKAFGGKILISTDGRLHAGYDGECVLFPSKNQRDWSKFERFWDKSKKEYFDPNTLKPFDKVLVRDSYLRLWHLGLFSDFCPEAKHPFVCCGNSYRYCIPYNDETKYLLGTTEEASEYYSQYEYNNYNFCK